MAAGDTPREKQYGRHEQKVIAIAGASSGIGRATAQLLASRGYTVVLGASMSSPRWRRS